jgi:hypothetical protein
MKKENFIFWKPVGYSIHKVFCELNLAEWLFFLYVF